MNTGKKVLIRVIKSELVNGKPCYQCEEVESDQKVLLKKSPKLKDVTLHNNTKYFMIVNENWINHVDPFEEVMDENSEVETTSMTDLLDDLGVPKKVQKEMSKPISPYDVKNAGAKIGGLMHDVVQLATIDKDTSEEYLEEKLKMLIRLSDKYIQEELK